MRQLSAFAALLSIAAAACTEATGPSVRVSVVVGEDTLVPTLDSAGSVTWLRFSVPVSVHNAGPAPLTFAYCGYGIENHVANQWQPVWNPICTTSGTPATIDAGETRQLTVDVVGAVSGPAGPAWQAEPVQGLYRLRIGVIAAGPEINVESNSFVLVEPR